MNDSKLSLAQKFLAERHLDGWLLYDFHGNNPLARTFLEIPSHKMTTRRFYYWIPVKGEPVKIVHAIEPYTLDHAPGKKVLFNSWQGLEADLKKTLSGAKKIAMEYSRNNAIPYISMVDAGTVDFIRSLGIEVGSSGDILPYFTAVLSPAQAESHIRAARAVDEICQGAWKWISEHLKEGKSFTEYDVQQKIAADFRKRGLETDHDPIVAVNAHSADPHYAPEKDSCSPIRKGDFILIDLWAKEKGEGNVFGDITRVGVAASEPTDRQQEIFSIVRKAQKAASDLVIRRFAEKKRVEGWEVDDAARGVIEKAGFGKFFLHRTGHSIETSLHGSGAHMDNLEMHDVRPILPGTCFSVEPGIYLAGDFGVRLEYDVYVGLDGRVEITGGVQEEIVTLV